MSQKPTNKTRTGAADTQQRKPESKETGKMPARKTDDASTAG
jgi:hypothetical protein